MADVVTRQQALALGMTCQRVDALVRSGRWRALRRGVYLTGPDLPAGRAEAHAVQVQAAVLAHALPALGSHGSAATVHGLPLLVPQTGPPVLTFLRPPGALRHASRRGALSSVVPVEQVVVVHGARVTSVARTAIDLARAGNDLAAVVVLDAALRRVPRADVEEVLAGQTGWPGSARARHRLALADGLSESPLESVGRLRMAQVGLPAPALQVVVGDVHGPIGRVDYAWLDRKTVAEADGRVKYTDPAALWDEKRREDRLREAGFEVVRFTWGDALHRPEVLGSRVRQAFLRAGRRAA